MSAPTEQLELVVADAAMRRPELLADMADVLAPDDVQHGYLRAIYCAALIADDENIGHGYPAVHHVLRRYGHHTTERDACALFELGGIGTTIPTRHAVEAAALLAERARARRLLTAAHDAERAIGIGRPVEHVAVELAAAAMAAAA